MNVDPYSVLQLPKTFTLEQLRDQYKRLSRQVHPDRGGSKELFQIVNQCYKQLLDVYQGRMEKDYATLKEEFERFQRQETPAPASPPSPPAQPQYQRESRSQPASRYRQQEQAPPPRAKGEAPKLTRERFNELFEQNRIDTPWDAGYGAQMTSNGGARGEISVPKTMGKSFDHAQFERATAFATPQKAIQRYTDPEPAYLTKQLSFTEIGLDKVRDYSGTSRETRGGIQYTDYMKAHSTQRLVDPREVKERPMFRNVEDYETYRSQNTQMAPDEYEEYLVNKARAEADEKRRQMRVTQQDNRYQEAYERLQRRMLGM